jgi:hypothetical protein
MTAPSEAQNAFNGGDRTAATTLEPRVRDGLPVDGQAVRSEPEAGRATRRSRVLPFPVLADGTVDLPAGAVIVALDFEDDGGLGCRRRPATAWAEVGTGRAPRVQPESS